MEKSGSILQCWISSAKTPQKNNRIFIFCVFFFNVTKSLIYQIIQYLYVLFALENSENNEGAFPGHVESALENPIKSGDF